MRYFGEWGVIGCENDIYYPDWVAVRILLHDTLEECIEEVEKLMNWTHGIDFSSYDWDTHWSNNSHQMTKTSKSGYAPEIDPNMSYYAFVRVRW